MRQLYVDPAALATLSGASAMPDDAVIVMETWLAARDTTGALILDADGRLIASQLDAIAIRAQRDLETVSSGVVPEGIRNGAWDYITIDPVAGDIQSANNVACHACHNQADAWDYAFSYPRLVLAAETGETQYGTCDRVGRQPCETPVSDD